jgi:hypothetical protein
MKINMLVFHIVFFKSYSNPLKLLSWCFFFLKNQIHCNGLWGIGELVGRINKFNTMEVLDKFKIH